MRRHVWPLVAVAALVGGGLLAALAPEPGSPGWFAYTPLSSKEPGVVIDLLLLTRAQVVGLGVAALGVVLLAAWVGYLVGRSRR